MEDDSYHPPSEEETSLGNEDFIVPEDPLEQECFKLQLIATARSLKKKQQQLQAEQDLLVDRWTDVLTAEEYGLNRPAKSYPKRRLLPQSDEEAPERTSPSRNAERPPRGRNRAADRPPRGRDKAATQAEQQTAPPPCHNKDGKVRSHMYDLRQTLDSRAGHTRSIYGSRGRASRHDDGYLFGRDKPNHARAECRRRTPSELRRDAARYRGAAHPLCFTDEVLDHEFPEGFKPVNIESYDGTTDPAVWIEDFILHIHMARGDDLHAIKYLPLKLKGPARHWLNSLPENSIGSWEDLEEAFLDNFQGTYVRPPDADDLSHIVQQPGESARNSGLGS